MLSFETLGDPKLETALRAANDWLSSFARRTPPKWLSLLGHSGTGKTYLARQLWRKASHSANWSQCGYIQKAIYWPEFVQDLKRGDSYGLRDDMRKWPVLFLDDVLAERDPSGFATDELASLLGCRVGKWTIVTSNLGLDAIAKIETRIASRMIRDGNVAVRLDTQDFATRKAKR